MKKNPADLERKFKRDGCIHRHGDGGGGSPFCGKKHGGRCRSKDKDGECDQLKFPLHDGDHHCDKCGLSFK